MISNENQKNREDNVKEIEADDSLSIEDFIRELEAKEKDLHISSDLAIEIEDDDFAGEITPFLQAELMGDGGKAADVKSPGSESANLQAISRLEDEVSELQARIARTERERVELVEVMRRRQADFDNYRKRIERDRGDNLVNQVSGLAAQILPVLDNLDRALDFARHHDQPGSADFNKFFEGIVLVKKQLTEVLTGMGVQPIQAVGQPFDPYFHEAVATEETDVLPPNTITNELLRGYLLGEKIIRPSLVRVSVSPVSEVSTSKTETGDESSTSV